jgi:hypothetical protein
MKLTFIFVLIFQLFFAITSTAQTWTLDGVTYGVQGKGLWHFGTSASDPARTAQKLQPILEKLYQSKTHPLKWCEEVDKSFTGEVVELLWHMSGPHESVQKQLKEQDLGEESSFLWEDGWKSSSDLRIEIALGPTGNGALKVFNTDGQLIARCRCISSADRSKQSAAGGYKILQKSTSTIPGTQIKGTFSKEAGVWMSWAMKIDADRGIFIHGGSLATTSKGCIRVTKAIDDRLHDIIQTSCVVKVLHIDE